MEDIRSIYEKEKTKIQSRLKDFLSLNEEQMFNEFMFCLLTPQSNAQRCWQAIEEISKLGTLDIENVTRILSTKTRFHHTKARRIILAREYWDGIKDKLSNPRVTELRNFIAESVKGYGFKEASHFLRNIGKSNNSIAILDRHIIRNLNHMKLIDEAKIKSRKRYLEVEQTFLNYAREVKIPADELDLLWWSRENGEVFK